MPTPRTTRVRTSNVLRDNPTQLVVDAPLVANDNGAGYAAQSLANLAQAGSGVAEQLIARRRERATFEGTKAALDGREPTLEENKRDAFRLGYERVQTERSMVQVEQEALDYYQNTFDRDNGTPQQLQDGLDAIYKQHFAGIDDPTSDIDRALLPHVASGLESISATIHKDFGNVVREQQQQKTESAFYEIANHALSHGGKLDVQALHDDMLPTLGGARANELLTQIVTDAAERLGRPELIDAIPDKWSDGTPSPKFVPKFDDALRTSRRVAEAQQAHDLQLTAKRETEALKQRHETNEAQLVAAVLTGRSVTAKLPQLLLAGDITAETGRTLAAFERSAVADASTGSVNTAAVASLEVAIRTGRADQTTVIESLDALGTGNAARTEFTRLLTLVHSARDEKLGTAEAKGFREELEARTRPVSDPFGMRGLDPEAERAGHVVQATALRLYDEAVLNGTQPAEAMRKAIDAVQLPTTAAPRPALSPDEIRARVASGAMTEADAVALLDGAK